MVIVNLCGGLGNQMFQYAAGRALALRCGVELALDLSWYESIEGGTPREYTLGVFPLLARVAVERELSTLKERQEPLAGKVVRTLFRKQLAPPETAVVEPHYAYWPGFEHVGVPAYLQGFWQNERYFASEAATIRSDFTFPALPEAAAVMAAAILQTPCSLSVHVRRGDYVHDAATRNFHGGCTDTYYQAAVHAVAAKTGLEPTLFVFSDEPAWVRGNFDAQGCRMVVVDFPEHGVNPHHDMHLMHLCRHHIIANSSFSWWGAWLSGENGVVCCPERWFTPASGMLGHPAPARWIRL